AGDGSIMASRSEEITELIDVFSKSQYRAREVTQSVERIEERCLELFDRDYKYSIIHNTNGDVCGHYPRKIVFLEYESSDNNKESFESTVQISKLQDLVNRSKMARCRGRFVCPVILYNGKHVCRSSTLAGWGELYGRTGYNYIFSGGSDDTFGDAEEVPEADCAVRNNDSQLFDKVRGSDIKLLKYLSVCYICDLMVENKKVKFGLNVTSSEKVDKAHRYADFTLLSVPYPGCEFFREYKDRDYTAEGLVFNWNQDYVDAPLTIPDFFTRNLNINWSEYQSWDLVQQTQNYLKLLLHIINSDDENGLLVHCISGWDRTPLFVSLLRLSLWADRAIHAILFFLSLNFLNILTTVIKQQISNLYANDFILSLSLSESRDRGSVTSLSSDFSLITEDTSAPSSLHAEATDLTTSGLQASNGRKGMPLSSHSVHWNRPLASEERMPNIITEASPLGSFKSSSSSSSNHSDQNVTRTGSTPLAVPGRRPRVEYARSGSSLSTDYGSWQIVSGCGSIHDLPPVPSESPLPFSFQDEGPNGRMCTFVPDRQVRLEAVRELFLAAYSSTVGLKSSSPSPSGAISGLLEQFARGVGLRGTNAII
uniref:Myotubularin-related protein 14-like n=1 Tax=Sinocyclocheilus rhinocerous TaxID=307959 RepID=A0A673HJH7_9TELE